MRLGIALFASLLLLTVGGLSLAQKTPAVPAAKAAKAESPYTLKEVMQRLARSTDTIQLGLLSNNRLLIELGARAVADHPKPKGGLAPYLKDREQVKAVARSIDQLVHQTAVEIAEAAPKAEMLELAKMNAKMIEGCIGCHEVFRN